MSLSPGVRLGPYEHVVTVRAVSELRGAVPAYRPVIGGSELVIWGITFGILELLRGVAEGS